MNLNRNVLRETQNRLPLKEVSAQNFTSIEITNKTKLVSTTIIQQQENLSPTSLKSKLSATSRPILTAIRTKKISFNENENEMLISPMGKTDISVEPKLFLSESNKTREQLEQELFEL